MEISPLVLASVRDSEKWRQANVTTFLQKSVILAAVCNPGIAIVKLANHMEVDRGIIYSCVKALAKKKLVLRENKPKKTSGRETVIYPTPYAKDLVSIREESNS